MATRFASAAYRAALSIVVAASCSIFTLPAQALGFDVEFGGDSLKGVVNTGLSVGAQWRMEDRSGSLVGKTKNNPNLCPVAPNGAGTSCQGHLDTPGLGHELLNSYIGEGTGANQAAVDGLGQFSNNNDDGNLNYDKHDLTQLTTKLTTDLTLTWHDVTLFVRGYGYYDAENNNREDYSPNTQTANTVADGRRGIGEATKRERNGITNEQAGVGYKLLDANLSTSIPLGDERDLTIKLGRQNINWGESTLLVVGSLNSFSAPNVNALYRPAFLDIAEVLEPVPALFASTSITDNLSVEVFYQYQWEAAEIPPAGSFLSTVDIGSDNQRDYLFIDFGKVAEDPDRLGLPDQIMLSTITDTSGTIDLLPQNEAKNDGQYGIAFKWYAENLNNGTEFGFYASRYHSRLPYLSFYEGEYGCLSGPNAPLPAAPGLTKPLQDVLATTSACSSNGITPDFDLGLFLESLLPAGLAPAVRDQVIGANGSAFTLDTVKARLEYPEGIEMYGVSFNTTFGEVSLQGEIAYRPNMPLQVDHEDLAFAALQNIFPKGNGTGAVGDSYDFGVVGGVGNVLTLAQLPGARYGVPDFISAYRGRDPLSYAEGEYIRGWEYFKVAQYNLGATQVIGPNNWIGADQVLLIGELGAVQIFDLPDLDELQIEGPGTFTHASAGADGTGADGSDRANSDVIGPSGIRFNPTQQRDGFVTDFSWGYRAIGILRYENILPGGIGMEPTIIFSHDVNGTSPGPGENFVEGRKSAIINNVIRLSQELNIAFGYAWFFGAGDRNLLRDRDFAQFGLRYQF